MEDSGERLHRSAAVAASREAGRPRTRRRARLLNKAEKDPLSVLADKRFLRPHFVQAFFDLCDAKILEAPWAVEDYVTAAVQLAEKTGDRHHACRAAGVVVHACINNEAWEQAGDLLEAYREGAMGCCPACRSDWLRRQGDLLMETRDPGRAREVLERSAAALGDDLDDQARAHILFIRGIAHYGLGDVDAGLADMGETLRLFSLATQKAYFVEAIALIACFLEHSDEADHYEAALDHLTRFRERLKGLRHWGEVRDRLRWVTGQIEACLDRPRVGRPLLERARKNSARHSPHRHTLAIGLDEALIICRNQRPELYIHSLRRIVRWCSRTLKLEEELRRGLDAAVRELEEEPYSAQSILRDLRRSYVVPVPCLVGLL